MVGRSIIHGWSFGAVRVRWGLFASVLFTNEAPCDAESGFVFDADFKFDISAQMFLCCGRMFRSFVNYMGSFG